MFLLSLHEYALIFQYFNENGSEGLAGNPPGGLLARGSMPLKYFVDFKKPAGKH